jgi:hypothetical protein
MVKTEVLVFDVTTPILNFLPQLVVDVTTQCDNSNFEFLPQPKPISKMLIQLMHTPRHMHKLCISAFPLSLKKCWNRASTTFVTLLVCSIKMSAQNKGDTGTCIADVTILCHLSAQNKGDTGICISDVTIRPMHHARIWEPWNSRKTLRNS